MHIDEHGKMCPQNEGEPGQRWKGADFSKGAMTALLKVPVVRVIATYTAKPPLPPVGSSAVCRHPVSLPIIDIDAVMQAIEELKFPHSQKDFDKGQKRLWATLRFRLAMSKGLYTCMLQIFKIAGV